MSTVNQLVRKARTRRNEKTKVPALAGSPQKRGVCTRVYTTTPEEAELGPAQGGQGAPHQRLRSHQLHRRRRPQPAGALGGADPRRPREGSAGVRYHTVRGSLDCAGVNDRKQSRSKYGAKRPKT